MVNQKKNLSLYDINDVQTVCPQILADQEAPLDSSGAPHYYLPPRIFDPCHMPEKMLEFFK
jgi:hypothetical protein